MLEFTIGAVFGLAINYALGRLMAPSAYEDDRRSWWLSYALISVPMATVFGYCATAAP